MALVVAFLLRSSGVGSLCCEFPNPGCECGEPGAPEAGQGLQKSGGLCSEQYVHPADTLLGLWKERMCQEECESL